jgi:hypothetical protein
VPRAREDQPAPARQPRRDDRFVHLNSTTIWTIGPLAGLGDQARLLWLRLATGPEVTPIPGLVLATSADIAASLGWRVEIVESVAASIPATALRADWRAGVVWLPPIIDWQKPHSPRNVIGWSTTWAALPETPLAADIHADLRIHCAKRDPAFALAFDTLPVPIYAPPVEPPATIEIAGVSITASGISDDQREAVVVGLARILNVPIDLVRPAALVAAAPPATLALPALASFVPVAAPTPTPGRRQTKAGRIATEHGPKIDAILAYQDDRRHAAFVELAERAPTPIDHEVCRKRIAERMAEGRTDVELRTAIDRMYEHVGAGATPADRSARAAWWTAERWQPRPFGEMLRLEVGGARPQGVSGLVRQINAVAAGIGAAAISVLSKEQTRHLEHLLSLGHDDVSVLSTITDFAAIVRAQEARLQRSGQQLAPGEARLVKLWGPGLFRLSAWTGVQTAVERFNAGDTGEAVFVAVSRALQEAASAPAAARSG